ncbi:hypothetical protein C4552_03600 [Candidatus Parcubacteria bacterium]|nr:MAG: hypothetical protein C4552_03600 [Candidatus Parcubacteria bacterium]
MALDPWWQLDHDEKLDPKGSEPYRFEPWQLQLIRRVLRDSRSTEEAAQRLECSSGTLRRICKHNDLWRPRARPKRHPNSVPPHVVPRSTPQSAVRPSRCR